MKGVTPEVDAMAREYVIRAAVKLDPFRPPSKDSIKSLYGAGVEIGKVLVGLRPKPSK